MNQNSLVTKIFNYTEKKNKVYIIPTKFGIIYALILFTIFLIGLSYTNNMTLIVAFSMLTYFIIQMLKTHKIINHFLPSEFYFTSNYSDKEIECSMVTNNSATEFINIDLYTGKDSSIFIQKNTYKPNKLSFGVKLPRGYYKINRLKFSTRSDIGLFYVWKNYQINDSFYSYPKLIPHDLYNNRKNSLTNNIAEEFQYHIKYENSLSAKRIDWKVYAKTDQLYWKKHSGIQNKKIIIDLNDFNHEFEQNISEMAFIANFCFKNEIEWKLIINNTQLDSNKGKSHYIKTLEVLSKAIK